MQHIFQDGDQTVNFKTKDYRNIYEIYSQEIYRNTIIQKCNYTDKTVHERETSSESKIKKHRTITKLVKSDKCFENENEIVLSIF